MERLNSGVSKTIFRNISCIVIIGLTKSSMERGGGNKKIFQYCADSSGAILYLPALQGHSGRSIIDPSLQDNVIIPVSSSTFITSDVQSIYIPSSIQDWYREDKI